MHDESNLDRSSIPFEIVTMGASSSTNKPKSNKAAKDLSRKSIHAEKNSFTQQVQQIKEAQNPSVILVDHREEPSPFSVGATSRESKDHNIKAPKL